MNRIGIIGAMEEEVAHLKARLTDSHITQAFSMDFCEGWLDGVDVVVVQCGIGKVNAALCAATLVEKFAVTHVVNTGVAGSLDAAINIGDIVVSTDAVHHDMDCTAVGNPAGEIPRMDCSAFVADKSLREAAVAAANAVAPELGVFEGRVASGDQFVASPERKAFISKTFGALCCEMEGAPIAHACYLAHVPFVIVRAISDKADGSAEMDYPEFERAAAAHCGRIVEHLVKTL
ncbi:MAG: 5'-methylthioadenosine/adenosylhomocysteine nucleosidase [Coriobacteriales bacterium]|nr:5'-methylthioadenosine/adenosylhomocysteine nucleosidase [Coriobacteriales bacterium]